VASDKRFELDVTVFDQKDAGMMADLTEARFLK